jgi:hypothetical protein
MVLGIVSVVAVFLWFIAVPAAIVGLVLSIIGVARARAVGKGKGMAVAGIVLSAVGLLLPILGAAVIWFWRDISGWVGKSYSDIKGSDPADNLLPIWWWLTGG